MWIALAINLGMLAAAVVGGLVTGSLALLADAGHVISDLGAIALGLAAAGLATRPGAARRTFGYQRSEVIAALANGIALVVIAVLIIVAAIGRLEDPPDVETTGVIVIGAVGLAGNLLAAWILAGGDRSDINLEGVLRHAAADALGSLAVVVSGIVILASGWLPADPVASLVIAVLIAASSLRLIREPLDVLMEAAPEGVDPDELGRAICETAGVVGVHELHVWTVTSGFDALAAHVVVASAGDRDRARREVEFLLRERFGIAHTTLQMEEEGREGELLDVQLPLQAP
jgi:cobalt-zinc-cadmium efflux system protein